MTVVNHIIQRVLARKLFSKRIPSSSVSGQPRKWEHC